MKKSFIYILAAASVFSCGKAELSEPTLKGESIDLTIPETRVGLGDDGNYVFEDGDVIIAVATNGSIAELTNSGDAVNSFSGTFSKPLEDSKSIDLYYNCCDANGNVAYEQNGRPWLQAKDNAVNRDTENHIVLTSEMKAPAGVRTVAILSDVVKSIDFHANEKAVSTFADGAFSGENNVSVSLKDNAAFVNVPAGMTGGFWMKMTNEAGESMYKSWSNVTVDGNKGIKVSEFTPASVKLDVAITGFATSYSYYVGGGEVSGKDVNKANSVSNDWMGEGKASYTIERSGIPAKLLTFKSFTLVVDGDDFTYKADAEGKDIEVGDTTGHTTWGQKDITATVVYESADGIEYTGTATVTRHITGLPYVANPPKNSGDNPWKAVSGSTSKMTYDNYIFWTDSYVNLATTGGKPQIASPKFHIPSGEELKVNVGTKITLTAISPFGNLNVGNGYNLQIWNDDNNHLYDAQFYKNQTLETTFDNAIMTTNTSTWNIAYTYTMQGPKNHIYYFNINYR